MTRPVLIVDDDVDVAEALSLVLEDAGYAAEIAQNGAEGLERLRQDAPPTVILLDLMMPIMDGCEFRREQLRMREAASIPVIVLSADAHGARRAAEIGCADYLMKPLNLDRLLELLGRYGEASRRRSAGREHDS